jgi:cytochrome c-type biogenesis protein CcmH
MIFQKVIFIFVIAISSQVVAVEPNEVLDNTSLEERARQISKDLRCLVCQNESIDESDAALARDLRVLVRERLQVGDSNEEVLQFVVDRYGEFALLRPRINGVNYALWWFGPLFLIFSIITAVTYVRKLRKISKSSNDLSAPLNDEERKKFNEIMGD